MNNPYAGRHRPTIDRVPMRVVGTMDENGWVRDMDARREGYWYTPRHSKPVAS
jgi:hypothetical protein